MMGQEEHQNQGLSMEIKKYIYTNCSIHYPQREKNPLFKFQNAQFLINLSSSHQGKGPPIRN